MSPLEQRVAIAEACGWKCQEYAGGIGSVDGPEQCFIWTSPRVNGVQSHGDENTLPDYLNDLNAIHAAWETLNIMQRDRFRMELCCLAGTRNDCHDGYVCATAARRSEAFLRTIDKWKDAA